MREIEVKILNIDRKSLEQRLLELGAEKVFDADIETLHFDSPDNSIRKKNQTLRLRKAGDKAYLTFKEPIEQKEAKIKEEHEIEVSDYSTTRKILESLGYAVKETILKHRTSYLIGSTHFELDKHHGQYEFVPEFLEIEAKDIDTIHKYVKLLGFTKQDCKPWTIHDVVKNLYPDYMKQIS